jgi:hypothetical protein
MRWQRRARTAVTVLAISLIVTAQFAMAADPKQGPTNPTGFGDLLPAPDLTHGDTRTLFEQYNPMAYGLDVDSSLRDPLRPVFNGFAQLLMLYIVAATRAAIAIGWWMFSFADIRPLTDATSHAIGGVSSVLSQWLLPSALAIGAVAAYIQRRSSGTAMGQLVWILAAGVLAVSLALSPTTWLKGVDGARQAGAETVMGASSQVTGTTLKTPIEMPEPAFVGSDRDTMLRKSGDVAWRGFAATPWCIAEFGSLDACSRYGKAMLDIGTDNGKRMDYINGPVAKAEGGGDSATVKWAKGENAFGRIGVLLIAAVATSLFAFLTIGLAATALMAFVGCLVMLVVGVVFACMFVIPGRPRQWGMNWLEALLGLLLQSVAAMLVFGIALSLLTAVFSLTTVLGWLPVTGLALVVLIAAFRLRQLLESMTASMRPGAASLLLGSGARRGSVQAVRRIVTAIRGSSAKPSTPERSAGRDRRDEGVDQADGRVGTGRIYRKAPPPLAGRVGEPDAENSPAPNGRKPRVGERSGPGTESTTRRPGGPRMPGRGDRGRSAAPAGVHIAGRADGASVRTDSSSAGKDRAKDVYRGGTVEQAKARPDSTRNSTELSSGRHAKPSSTATQLRNGHYETRRPMYSASLREGPPKASRHPQKQVRTPRRYREYSATRSSGPVSSRTSGGR